MAVVLVVVSTDHSDVEDAVRSVSGAMKRAGYDVLNYLSTPENEERCFSVKALVEVCEPEVNPDARP